MGYFRSSLYPIPEKIPKIEIDYKPETFPAFQKDSPCEKMKTECISDERLG